MATSIRQFNVELYQEHLEEASFLYEQRLAYLHDPEVNWPDLRDWEDRFEAHIDALVVGGELALDVCRQKAATGDTGEIHAALCVLCRQDRKDDAFAALGALDPTDQEALRAAAHALCCEAPKGWRDDLLRAFQDRQQHLAHLLARVIGYRRFALEDALRSELAENPSRERAALAWALGRIGSAGSIPLLRSLLDSDDSLVCEASAIALMRLGDQTPLQRAIMSAQTQSWARRVLGIGGGPQAVAVLLRAAKGPAAKPDAIIGLGLLGDLAAIAPLVDLLDDDKLRESASLALNTITGAQLFERIFVPDKFDPDELSDEERAALEKDGTLPTRLGEPYGNWERGALRDKTAWRAWLEENKHRFSRQHRWRMGHPYGPLALFECLKCETSPYAVRDATYEELVVRYGLDVPFEIDLPVQRQLRFLGKIESWAASHSGKFVDGCWYFDGRLQA